MAQKIIGGIALIIGLGLIVWGRSMAGTPGSTVENLVNGATTDRSMYVYIGGAALALYGIFQMVRKRK